jgi:hypothetical protein
MSYPFVPPGGGQILANSLGWFPFQRRGRLHPNDKNSYFLPLCGMPASPPQMEQCFDSLWSHENSDPHQTWLNAHVPA